MTLEQAVEILNRERHNNSDGWFLDSRSRLVEDGGFSSDDMFSEFEAIAIAEKYERQRVQREREAEAREDWIQAITEPPPG